MSQNLFRRGRVYKFKKISILNETEVTNIIDYFKQILIYIHSLPSIYFKPSNTITIADRSKRDYIINCQFCP